MKKLVIVCALALFAFACETKVDMTWKFTKELDTANPTIGLYDHTDNNETLASVTLDDAVKTVTVSCTSGNSICFGGDFTLAGTEFAIGCGANCSDYDSAYASEWCAECEETTVAITFDNFLK